MGAGEPTSQGTLSYASGLPRAGRSVYLRLARGVLSEYFIFIIAVVYFLAALPFVPELATGASLWNLFTGMLPLLAVAIGQTVVLIAGGIDLSVTAIIAATSMAGAAVMKHAGIGGGEGAEVSLAIAAMLGLGMMIGLLNGLAITVLVMPPFIVTLSMMMVVGGSTLWLSNSRNISNLPESFIAIGFESAWGMPYALLIVGVLAVVIHVMLGRTLLGRWVYAVGHNAKTSLISGVPVRRVTISAYVVSGLCAAVGSILLTAQLETGSPTQGSTILLDVIGAAVIGGTSLFGGKGKVLWTFFGVLLFALIAHTLSLLGLAFFTIMMIKGGVILLAAALDVLRVRLMGGAG